jgi:hypothetical protein
MALQEKIYINRMVGISVPNLGLLVLLNELFLELWLIVKGFALSAMATASAI